MEILSLGEKIKRRRKDLNMTLKDLAGDRITPGQISLVESGKSNPSMDLLEYLASALNTSVEYLMESEETQAEKICLYYEDMAEFYVLNGNFNNGQQNIEKALYYAEKYNLNYRKAKNLYLNGIICIEKGDATSSQQYLLSANSIFIKESCFEDVVKTFLKLGCITLECKAYHSSYSYFQQAEKVFADNDIGDDFLLGQIYYYIAFTYFKLDNLDKAINYSYLAKEKFNQIDNIKEYAKSLLLIAEEYSKNGNIDKAIKYSKKTIKAFKDVNDSECLSEIENDLGKLFFEFENVEESFIHLNKAKEIREKNRDRKLTETLINICENYIKLKDVESSKNILDEIISSLSDGDEDSLVRYYLLKYRINILENKTKEAENTLFLALDYAKKTNNRKKAAEVSIMLGKYYMDSCNDKNATIYLNNGVEIFRELGILK